MKYYTISQVVTALDAVYKGLAEKHAAMTRALEVIPYEENNARRDRRYSEEGKKARLADIRNKAESMRATLRDIERESKTEFRRILADAEKSFPQFKARPEDIDREMLSLFDSGILTPDEMFDLAQRYEGQNVTMSRMLGKRMTDYIEQHYDEMSETEQHGSVMIPTAKAKSLQNLEALAVRLKDAESPLASVIGKYQVAYDSALRADEDGAAGAAIQGAAYDEMFESTSKMAEQADHECRLTAID